MSYEAMKQIGVVNDAVRYQCCTHLGQQVIVDVCSDGWCQATAVDMLQSATLTVHVKIRVETETVDIAPQRIAGPIMAMHAECGALYNVKSNEGTDVIKNAMRVPSLHHPLLLFITPAGLQYTVKPEELCELCS